MALRAAADDEQQFTMRAMVDTHRSFMDLLMVYTNDPVWVEHSIHIMELLLAEEKYKVVGFGLEYTHARAGSRPKVVVAQMCVCHHVLVNHYCLATRPCEHFARFVNSCRCQNRRILGRGSRTVRLRLMVTRDGGHDVYPGSGPMYNRGAISSKRKHCFI